MVAFPSYIGEGGSIHFNNLGMDTMNVNTMEKSLEPMPSQNQCTMDCYMSFEREFCDGSTGTRTFRHDII